MVLADLQFSVRNSLLKLIIGLLVNCRWNHFHYTVFVTGKWLGVSGRHREQAFSEALKTERSHPLQDKLKKVKKRKRNRKIGHKL